MAQLSLEHLKGNTYYIPSPTNVGVYVENNSAILIDSGNDREAGRQILKLLNQQGWELRMIINTHSNADHVGGNAFLQERTGCQIAATQEEAVFIANPLLEPAFLYGGFPFKDLKNKFLMARPSSVTSVVTAPGQVPGTPLEAISLPGHFFGMIGLRTPDNILFIADSLFPENIINKYHLFYLLDLKAHFSTLDLLLSTGAELYIPSHGQPQHDLHSLVEVNRNKVEEIADKIQGLCERPSTTEELLEAISEAYHVSLNATQYVLLSSTLKSYLAYLLEEERVEFVCEGFKMVWRKRS